MQIVDEYTLSTLQTDETMLKLVKRFIFTRKKWYTIFSIVGLIVWSHIINSHKFVILCHLLSILFATMQKLLSGQRQHKHQGIFSVLLWFYAKAN